MRLLASSSLVLAFAAPASLACSSSSSTPSGNDAGAANDAANDAAMPGCDAGEPPDPYATSQPFACNESLQTITTRPPVTLSFDLVVPPEGQAATAIVVLLAGGNGLLHLGDAGIGSAGDNFCVRTRQMYAAAGFVVAVPDAPSDHATGLDGFRASQDHATDLGKLAMHLRAAYPGLAVWLVGTSRGTISATDAMARLDGAAKPDHVVLTSSVTVTPPSASDAEDIHSVPGWQSSLTAAVPVLMIDDSLDACGASPPSGAQTLAKAIGDGEYLVLVDGGPPPPADAGAGAACGGLAYHGFYENDDLVVGQTIIPFLRSH